MIQFCLIKCCRIFLQKGIFSVMIFVRFDLFSKAMQNNIHMYTQKTVFAKLAKLLASKLSSRFNIWASQIQNILLNKKYRIISIPYWLQKISLYWDFGSKILIVDYWILFTHFDFTRKKSTQNNFSLQLQKINNFLWIIFSLFLLQYWRMWFISMLWIIGRHQK